ncbi:MAG: Bug family tripartite tricarboxylate transporter substrate binding protein [Thermodesulfobacteriota bacterium]
MGSAVSRRKFLEMMGLAGLASGMPSFLSVDRATAKEVYPSSRITFVCGSPPGGGSDLAARGVATFLPQYLKEVSSSAKGGEIVVKNVPTASGMKARTTVYNSDPDGYTIGDFIQGYLFDYTFGSDKPSFDVKKFTWLFASNMAVYVLVSRKNGPATWEEMLGAAKKEPLRWLAGSYASSMHINSIWVKEVVDIPARFLTIAGASGVVSSLIRGDGDVTMIPIDSAKAVIDSKDVNVLATFTEKRYYPNAPTIIEKGYPQFLPHVNSARLVMGPPSMTPEAKEILIKAVQKMYGDPKYQAYCRTLGSILFPMVGKQVDEAIANRIKLYQDLAPILKKHMKFG